MLQIKKVVSISLYIALGFYALSILFHLIFDYHHISLSISRHLIEGVLFIITGILIWFFTRSKLLNSEDNIKWYNLYKIHLAIFAILSFSIFSVPKKNHSSEFDGIANLILIAIWIIFPLAFTFISYLLFKKYPLRSFTIIPLTLYCLALLFYFCVLINIAI